MNKKGAVFNTLMWFFKIFFLVVVLFTLIFLVRSFIITELDIFNAEADIFIQRLLLTRNGFSYYDEDLDRVYPGIVDLEKFSSVDIDKLLNNSIYYGPENKRIAAGITLRDENDNTIKSIYYNPEYYLWWKEMLEARWIKGPGGVSAKTKKIPVWILGDGFNNGFLEIEVIIPNS